MATMTARQCEIAAEAYTACLLAQAGYDVLVQYGANQPHYDLMAVKGLRKLPISVKGSQDGGWMLAVRYVGKGVSYHEAVDRWLNNQREDVLYFVVQFIGTPIGTAPCVYVAQPSEIAEQLKAQCCGRGHGALAEDNKKYNPRSKYDDKIPPHWAFSSSRVDSM